MTKIKEDLGKTSYQKEDGSRGYLEDIDWTQYPNLSQEEKEDFELQVEGPPALDDAYGIEEMLYSRYPYNLQDYWDTKEVDPHEAERTEKMWKDWEQRPEYVPEPQGKYVYDEPSMVDDFKSYVSRKKDKVKSLFSKKRESNIRRKPRYKAIFK